LYVSPEDTVRLLARPAGAPMTDAPLPGTFPPLSGSRLEALREAFELTAFDLDLLLIALAPELDLRYERLYAYLQDDVTRRKPSVELALNLLCRCATEKIARRAHLAPEAPLLRHGIVRLLADPSHASPPLLAHYLEADAQMVRYLFRGQGLDPRLTAFCRCLGQAQLRTLLGRDSRAADRARALAELAAAGAEPLRLYFYGADGAVLEDTAAELANRLGLSLLTADIGAMLDAGRDVAALLAPIFRESWCQRAILHVEGLQELAEPGRGLLLRGLNHQLELHRGIVILAGTAAPSGLTGAAAGCLAIDFSEADLAQRRRTWQHLLGDELDEASISALSNRFRLSPARIVDVVDGARRQTAWQGALAGEAKRALRLNDLLHQIHAQSAQGLVAVARPVKERHSRGDLVLPADTLAQLGEICTHVRQRHVVHDQWGFAGKLPLGKGTAALFTGGSGTGKTMAAGVIAGELELALYRIDLARMVSKYIGETEKNLERVFAAAQDANAILFFDEADALFGKRSEVKDAHDRYANLEVGFLLQRMEEYEGLAILATNLRQHLDEAFLRRLQFVIEFPFPDEADRLRIWRVLLPPQAPLADDVDFDWLAREVRVAGGHLRNIALAAAFMAAEERAAVHQRHLLRAAQREYQKLGRAWTHKTA